MYPESSEGLNRETDRSVYFFTPAFHPLDNFSAHAIELWGHIFPTAEHAYFWKKFEDHKEIAKQVLNARSPEEAQQVSVLNKSLVSESWSEQKVRLMREILSAKALQHTDVQEALRRTGDRDIVENSPVDDFWGSGPDGSGENMVGKIWMEIREKYM